MTATAAAVLDRRGAAIGTRDQVYIRKGRYAGAHARVHGFFQTFVLVCLFDERGELTAVQDLVPAAHVEVIVKGERNGN